MAGVAHGRCGTDGLLQQLAVAASAEQGLHNLELWFNLKLEACCSHC